MYGNKDGSIPATFQVIYMIGWKKGVVAEGLKPRGSAKMTLKEIL